MSYWQNRLRMLILAGATALGGGCTFDDSRVPPQEDVPRVSPEADADACIPLESYNLGVELTDYNSGQIIDNAVIRARWEEDGGVGCLHSEENNETYYLCLEIPPDSHLEVTVDGLTETFANPIDPCGPENQTRRYLFGIPNGADPIPDAGSDLDARVSDIYDRGSDVRDIMGADIRDTEIDAHLDVTSDAYDTGMDVRDVGAEIREDADLGAAGDIREDNVDTRDAIGELDPDGYDVGGDIRDSGLDTLDLNYDYVDTRDAIGELDPDVYDVGGDIRDSGLDTLDLNYDYVDTRDAIGELDPDGYDTIGELDSSVSDPDILRDGSIDALIDIEVEEITCPTDGFVGYWNFDENSGSIAYDSSPNGNNGTISGAEWTTGITGSALNFDGTNDYINIPHHESLNLGSGPFTFSLWVRATETGGVFLDKHISGCCLYRFGVGGGRAEINVHSSSGAGDSIMGESLINDGKWHYLVGIRDNIGGEEEFRIYVDGTEDASKPTAAIDTNNTSSLRIGSLTTNDNDGYFNGVIDEIKIYPCALTPGQVREEFERY